MAVDVHDTSRDPLTRDLDLPRGRAREWVRSADREYHLTGDDVRTLAAVGAFRVVSAGDLNARSRHWPTRPSRSVERLRDDGLVRTMPHVIGKERTTVVTLTERGQELLERHRRPTSGDGWQSFHAGVSKPRELAHDTRLYPAYEKAVERLEARGAKLRRVVLEEDLKSRYQRFLQEANRGRHDSSGRPTRSREDVEEWAREHRLPCENGHVQFPDVRLEIEERDGRREVEDLEVVTPHYRGAHAAAKARSGFSRSGAMGARVGGTGGGRGGGRGRSPQLAEEMLP
jgi:DNA-binding MarR family transcriptional regulator